MTTPDRELNPDRDGARWRLSPNSDHARGLAWSGLGFLCPSSHAHIQANRCLTQWLSSLWVTHRHSPSCPQWKHSSVCGGQLQCVQPGLAWWSLARRLTLSAPCRQTPQGSQSIMGGPCDSASLHQLLIEP